MQNKHGEIVFYQAEDGGSSFEVSLYKESVWLSLNQMIELFGRDKSVVSRHLNNIFKSGELKRNAVVAKNATTTADGKTYQVNCYSLDSKVLGELLNRSEDYLRQRVLNPLVEQKNLRRAFPATPNDPRQAYTTNKTK